MKVNGKKISVNYIRPENVAMVEDSAELRFMDTPYYWLVKAIADALDTAISGDNTYVIIGTTKDTTALSMTCVQGPARDAVYGDTLAELGGKATTFITS